MIDEQYRESDISKGLMRLNLLRIEQIQEKGPFNRIRCFLQRVSNLARAIRKFGLTDMKKLSVDFRAVFVEKILYDYELPQNRDIEAEIEYSSPKKIRKKIVVYTSVFGDYDQIQNPFYVSVFCDYVAITDQSLPEDSIWKKKDMSSFAEFEQMDNYHKSKFCKMFPHLLFPEYDYSVWMDGNVIAVGDIYPFVDRLDSEHVMATFQNPKHDCIYTERNYLIYCNAVNTKEIDEQLYQYRREGFPEHFGMREFSIIVRKHNDEKLIKYMSEWWNQVNTFTMRDQISLPYVLWKNGESIDYIQMYEGNWRTNPRFLFVGHIWRHVL